MDRIGPQHVRTFFQGWGEELDGSGLGAVEYALTSEDWFRRAETAAGSGCVGAGNLEASDG